MACLVPILFTPTCSWTTQPWSLWGEGPALCILLLPLSPPLHSSSHSQSIPALGFKHSILDAVHSNLKQEPSSSPHFCLLVLFKTRAGGLWAEVRAGRSLALATLQVGMLRFSKEEWLQQKLTGRGGLKATEPESPHATTS